MLRFNGYGLFLSATSAAEILFIINFEPILAEFVMADNEARLDVRKRVGVERRSPVDTRPEGKGN
jgi:hypothetical protein